MVIYKTKKLLSFELHVYDLYYMLMAKRKINKIISKPGTFFNRSIFNKDLDMSGINIHIEILFMIFKYINFDIRNFIIVIFQHS